MSGALGKLFRERLTRAGAIGPLFARFDATLRGAGNITMSGQIVDATPVQAPRQRNTQAEKDTSRPDRVPEEWTRKPAKLRHKNRDARWTVKLTKAKPRQDGTMPAVDLTSACHPFPLRARGPLARFAIPAFGYRNHIAIDRRFGLIRTWIATDAAAHEGNRCGWLSRKRCGWSKISASLQTSSAATTEPLTDRLERLVPLKITRRRRRRLPA